jgi:UDP-glucose 4-epimerase
LTSRDAHVSWGDRGRVVVFGAGGYFGRHLATALARQGADLVVSARTSGVVPPVGRFIAADIRKRDEVEAVVEDARLVFFVAGRTGTLVSFDAYPDFVETNQTALLHLLDVVRRRNLPARIVLPSTRLVYRGGTGILDEGAPLLPRTIYGASKLACEHYLQSYSAAFGVAASVFRIGVVYGESVEGRGTPFGTVAHFVREARAGRDLVIFGNGAQRRSLVHVDDVVDVTLAATRNAQEPFELFNIGGPDELSVSDIAHAVAQTFGVNVLQRPWEQRHLSIETGDTVLSSEKVLAAAQVNYRHRFHEWLRAAAVRSSPHLAPSSDEAGPGT